MKSRLLLGAALIPLVAALLIAGPAQLGGGATYVTTYGGSMEPAIHSGDLVLVREAPHYRTGDAVAYHNDELGVVVLHRVIAIHNGRYTLKGDNNSWVDPGKRTRQELIGKAWLHIPGGGTWLRRITSPPSLAAAGFLLFFSGGTAARIRRRRTKDRRLMAQHSAPRPHPLTGMLPSLRPIAVGIAVLGVASVAAAGIAWTRPAHVAGAAEQAVTATVDFSYTATVPPSAAYDGTTVTDPQPLFRELTDFVDVGFHYQGRPGTVTVDAELSTPGGWRSTVRLADPVRFDGEQHDGSVHLDLAAFEARAEAAAAVTGLPATPVQIAVVPRVILGGGDEIAPRLELTLDAHALRLSGEEEALTVESSTSVTDAGERPATISLFGRGMEVGTLRRLSLAAIALAVLLLATFAVATRVAGPMDPSERIRRRYCDLILPVLPVALPAGRPVIDVPGVESLVTLAERYGLLVLHWSRSGVDTYVVQDDHTTYRFRGSRDGAPDEPATAGDQASADMARDAGSPRP